jgi:Fe-S cluster biogenesis protein NfuA/nitrite reductase/ring-hydroxylating ferredoxin subunit
VSGEKLDAGVVGDRIERLLDDLSAVANPTIREKIEELMTTTVEFYGAGLRRILELLYERPDGEVLIDELADDDFVASLLILHDLHPYDLPTRIERALARVRPYLGSHEGDVEVLGVTDEGVVKVRLQGSCDGCPSSAATLKLAIERAILEAAPEIAAVEADGLETAPDPPAQASGSLLQIGMGGPPETRPPSNGGGRGAARVATLGALPSRSLFAEEIDGVPVLFCRIGGDLYAYRNRCASCGSRLDNGVLRDAALSCVQCGEEYDAKRAGRAIDPARAPAVHLAPMPLLESAGVVEIVMPEVS